jgi:O-antigen/teichoic acid export membrane protein
VASLLESTRWPTWRGAAAVLRSERLLQHNTIVAAGTLVAGVLGVAFQSLISHQYRPADYGAVFAVVTAITFLGLPASAFTLLMARETSRGRASGQEAPSAALLRQGNRILLWTGFVMACGLALTSGQLGRAMSVPVNLWIAAALGLPFAAATPMLFGELQGEQRFGEYAALSAGLATLKLLGAIVLGYFLGSLGVILGISLAAAVVYAVARSRLSKKFDVKSRFPWWRPAAKYLIVVLPSTLALSAFLSTDVLMVKYYFPTGDAGKYAAVAAAGRAIFWGASGVAAVLFPKLAFRLARGSSGIQLVIASLAFVAISGVGGFAFLSIASTWVLRGFAGDAYVAAAPYLPWYAIAMTLLGGASVLIASNQARGRAGFLAIVLPATALEPVLIAVFHQNLWQVVQIMVVSMLVLFFALVLLYAAEQLRQTVPLSAREPGVETKPFR